MVRRPLSLQLSASASRAALTLAAGMLLAAQSGASAQQSGQAPRQAAPAQRPAAATPPKPKDKLLVEANELIYDKEKDTVTASGNAQLYYGGRVLEADRVTYNRKTKRVFAEGNARLTENNGIRYFGDRFELTDDFKNGFIDSLRSVSPDKQRFSAARGERVDGETSVFDRGTYTPCEPCKDNPERPPLWQVRAARIIHKTSEQTIYYENATLEFWGVPIAYMPFWSAPDPTVSRKSGFLPISFINKKSLGFGVTTPYFWAVAPNVDIVLTPTFLTRQGVLGQVEFAHRLMHGSYNIRAAGIFQQDKDYFLPDPIGPAGQDFRGSIETKGDFFINQKWKFGWDLAFSTDKFFFNNYKVRSESVTTGYSRESVSSLYLNGQGARSWFDARAFYFRPLVSNEWQKNQPVVHPVIDYDRRFSPSGIGGELQFSANLTSLSREAASFQALPTQPTVLGNAGSPGLFVGMTKKNAKGQSYYYSIGEGCYTYTRGNCILRGVAGNYTRGTVALSWRKSFIDAAGQVWTPFASVQADTVIAGLNTTEYKADPTNINVYGNDKQRFFVTDTTQFSGRVMPAAGMTYKYPFVAFQGSVTHEIAPIAQIIARPNEGRAGKVINEDAQSLVFDDTVLFTSNKFSGYDRTEGGVRANYGFQYSALGAGGASARVLVGQSHHLAGRNSYANPDTANTGLDSGLESRQSDYVGRVTLSTGSLLTFSAFGRFDERTLALRRGEATAAFSYGPLFLSTTYMRLAPQPMLGFNLRREGMMNQFRVALPRNWYATGTLLYDMDRHLQDRTYHVAYPVQFPRYNNSPFRVAQTSLAIGYRDECTDFSLTWVRGVNDMVTAGTKAQTSNIFMFKLELKNLGKVEHKQNLLGITNLFSDTPTTSTGPDL